MTAGDARLALTPPMGWNSWNRFRRQIDEQLVRGIADAMVELRMRDVGYRYVIVDDCWMARSRGRSGDLLPDPDRFPHGVAALAEYVHERGLLFGIYSSPGETTCAGYPGSAGHKERDAQLFAAWGIDYLKYDWCYATDVPSHAFLRMRDALAATGRPIVYSVNGGAASRAKPWSWGGSDLWALDAVNCWRTSNDIWARWDTDGTIAERSIMTILDEQVGLERFARPGRWNDPDMLEVGNDGLTDMESRTHFSLSSMLAAPLIAGNDLRDMSAAALAVLTNTDVIAVDQDPLGRQGRRIRRDGASEVWLRELSGGDRAALLLNRGSEPLTVEIAAAEGVLEGDATYSVTDLWSGSSIETAEVLRSIVEPHGCTMLRFARCG
ncbi:glycoside hydrolase family 27 protein [Actinopolymorpha sp. B17G11]|uniref:glycoside hydrolase family 27 protein n=1 Tax=Actinopolymorpha sp. B17G11 TaxID=3160861 RepID=UPI0032E40D58